MGTDHRAMRRTTWVTILQAATPHASLKKMPQRANLHASTAALPKILCLHGGGTNEAIMRVQTAKVRRMLRDEAEFEFFEGTLPMTNVDPAVKRRFEGPYLSWYDVKHDAYEGVREPAEYVRALLDDQVTFSYPHADEAVARLEHHIDECGPYDALLGFSQGAILITLATAVRLHRARTGLGPPPSWRHNVLVCGMPVRAAEYADQLKTPLDFPSTISQGREDPAYEWCRRLAAQYADANYLEHPDGHRFPRGEATAALVALVRARLPPR